MEKMSFPRLLNPITYGLFIPVSLVVILLKPKIEQAGLDSVVLFMGNLILYLITAIALYVHQKGFLNKNPNVFFRTVYSSMLLRMLVCIVAVLTYAVIAGNKLNKYSVLICFLFYFLYTFLEVRRVLLLMKKQS